MKDYEPTAKKEPVNNSVYLPRVITHFQRNMRFTRMQHSGLGIVFTQRLKIPDRSAGGNNTVFMLP